MSLWSGEAYTIFAQSMDGASYARGHWPRERGLSAGSPLDPRPLLTMEDRYGGRTWYDEMDHSQMGGMDNSGEMMSMDDFRIAGHPPRPDHNSMAVDHSRMARNAGYARSHLRRNG